MVERTGTGDGLPERFRDIEQRVVAPPEQLPDTGSGPARSGTTRT
jgi:hypothetical protein